MSLEKILLRTCTLFIPRDKDGRFPLNLQIIQVRKEKLNIVEN